MHEIQATATKVAARNSLYVYTTAVSRMLFIATHHVLVHVHLRLCIRQAHLSTTTCMMCPMPAYQV